MRIGLPTFTRLARPTRPTSTRSIMTDREWNHLSTRMAAFHAKFRHDYKLIYALADSYDRRGLTLRKFVDYALQFNENLTFHHTIEDVHIFPVLATRMPEFRDEHPESHRLIHDGLDRYVAYLSSVKSAPQKYDPAALRANMDSFHDHLFNHLDEEEKCLRRSFIFRTDTLADCD